VRLQKVKRGTFVTQLIMPFMALKIRSRVPDVLRTILYRPRFFGRPYSDWCHATLRGPSKWSVWERELFASFTSRLNQCLF
jgi:hypothetical protein